MWNKETDQMNRSRILHSQKQKSTNNHRSLVIYLLLNWNKMEIFLIYSEKESEYLWHVSKQAEFSLELFMPCTIILIF